MLSWDAPWSLLALGLLIPMVLGLWRALWGLKARRDRYAERDLLRRIARIPEDASEALRLGVLLAAVLLAILALAGPRWGGHLGARLSGEVPSLVVACDVSRSMGVQDSNPDRMQAARDAIAGVLDNLSDWRAGLIAFADDAVVFCPMTSDVSAVETLSARLKPDLTELKPGTNLEAGLDKAIAQLAGRPGAILLVSDGEALSGDADQAAQAARKAGIPLYTACVGTPEGGPVPTGKDLFAQPTYRLGRDGAPVVSHANPQAMEALAKATGGLAVSAKEPGAAERLLSALHTRWSAEGTGSEGTPLAIWPLGLAVLLLLGEASYARRHGLRRLWRFRPVLGLTLVLGGLSQQAFTWPWTGWGDVRSAASAYQSGRWSDAESRLEQAAARHPDDSRVAYDLGCVEYQAGHFEPAAKAFTTALAHAPKGDRAASWLHYNLGNALYRLGEARGDARTRWTEAIRHYQAALDLDPSDTDARYNLDLVERRLKQLPKDRSKGSGKPQPSGTPKAPDQQNLPSDAEIQATLDALQHEERQHQAEQAPVPATPPPESASDLLKQLVNQAAHHEGFGDRPDW
jgi:Ca-activated chloride channel family protein